MTDYVDMWNEQNYDAIPDLVAESFVMYDPAAPEEGVPGPAGEVHGRDGLEAFMHGVAAGFPDFDVTILDMVSSDDLVMYEAAITMTHEGEFDGIPPTGREVKVREMSKYRVADGVIHEHRAYFDQQAIFEQLGLTDD
ncbi:ester cyclase [Halorussus sp. MSC15.2]|uniref:ester cyclase n=1 Tax=Halorussus sp. MSC15.2 TaxID=2283638 RepID=UPI0013D8115E|nr:ester cyclase [Halorussus sp. MSC15.2]NEU58773.1 ester cyclase [Halorussus sp. MSC15.2]